MIGALIVAYFPERTRLAQLVDRLICQVDCIIVVDNGGAGFLDSDICQNSAGLVRRMDMGGNVGVASALNIGVQALINMGAHWVVTFDQDSLPPSTFVSEMRDQIEIAEKKFKSMIGAIGPAIVDVRGANVRTAPFASLQGWWPKKIEVAGNKGALSVAHVITSGCFVKAEAWATCRFDDQLFIDLVDIEWCWRVADAGFEVLGAPAVRMQHELSDAPQRRVLGLGVSKYSSLRRYYSVRNAIYLLTRKRLSVCRVIYLLKSLGISLFSAVIGDDKPKSSLRCAVHGVLDGVRGEMGVALSHD